MNEFSAYARPSRGGWQAVLRLARDGEAQPILDKGGVPIWYEDELTATKAALAHVLAYFNGHLVRSGEIAGGSVKAAKFAAAERIFLKGRMIEVKRKGGAFRE